MKKDSVDLGCDTWVSQQKEFLKAGKIIQFFVRVNTGKPKTRWVSLGIDESVKVDINQPPQKGLANQALQQLFSVLLDIPLSRIVIKGTKSRRKLILIV